MVNSGRFDIIKIISIYYIYNFFLVIVLLNYRTSSTSSKFFLYYLINSPYFYSLDHPEDTRTNLRKLLTAREHFGWMLKNSKLSTHRKSTHRKQHAQSKKKTSTHKKRIQYVHRCSMWTHTYVYKLSYKPTSVSHSKRHHTKDTRLPFWAVRRTCTYFCSWRDTLPYFGIHFTIYIFSIRWLWRLIL